MEDEMDVKSYSRVGNDHRGTHVGKNIYTRDVCIKQITIPNEANHRLIQVLNGGSPVDLLRGVFQKIADLDDTNLAQKPSLLRDVLEENNKYDCDHLCWRCASKEEYIKICSLLKSGVGYGELLIESMIQGRPIATFKFREPVKVDVKFALLDPDFTNDTRNGSSEENCKEMRTNSHFTPGTILPSLTYHRQFEIRCIEVPAPKPGRSYESGWEHVEFAIGDSGEDLKRFVERTKNYINWDYGGFTKEVNGDVAVSFEFDTSPATSSNVVKRSKGCVKFHEQPLDEVIAWEKASGHVQNIPRDYFSK